MTLSTVDQSTVLIRTKRDLARTHLDPHAIHRCHKLAANDWHNPLRYRVFVPVIFLTRHEGQKHNISRIIPGACCQTLAIPWIKVISLKSSNHSSF
jgi:hypothetical protein